MKKYFYSDGNEKNGPLSLDELKQENISKETLIWFEGLDDWKPAGDLDDMKPILELNPPPIENLEEKQIEESLPKQESTQKRTQLGLKEASQGWIIAGFIFSILGGYLGVIIGFNYAFGKYKSETKRLGWIMAILGIFSSATWRSI